MPRKIVNMKRILAVLVIGLIVVSCDTKTEQTMTVSGNIKGLKKGTLFLQNFKDSTLVSLDSLEISGDGSFEFSQELEHPEIFYLYLDKKDNNNINDRITFFGEPGEITIRTSWNTFDIEPEIYGSKSQEKLEEFNNMMSKFSIRELELLQLTTQPEFQGDSLKLDSIQRLVNHNTVGSYRYALNFGLTNSSSYVTPYAMLNVSDRANPKYLDSIYKALAPEVAESKYGKALKNYLSK